MPTLEPLPTESVAAGGSPRVEASGSGGVAPTSTPVPIAAGPTGSDALSGPIVPVIGLIVGLILAGFVLTKVRGRPAGQPLPAGAMAMAAPVGTEHFGDGTARAEPAAVNAAGAYPWLERELSSDPVAAPAPSALEAVPPPTAPPLDEAGTSPASAIATDPWASARTIAIHVEQIDLGED